MTTIATQVEGIRTVSGTSERSAVFPSPATGQKVYNQTTNAIERWSGSAWVAVGTMRGMYDVRHYGAMGDGTTDDTLAIQAAIDAAALGVISGSTSGDGGIVYMPPGTYKISHIDVPPHVQLIGAGMMSTVITSDYNGYAVAVGADDAINFAYGCEVSNLTILCTFLATGGLHVRGTSGFKAENVIVEGPGATSTSRGVFLDKGLLANIFTVMYNVDSHYHKYPFYVSESTTSITAFGCNAIALTTANHSGLFVEAGGGAQSRWFGGNFESCAIGIEISGFGVMFFGTRFEGNTVNVRLNAGANANSFTGCGGLNDGTVTDNSGQTSNRFYGNLTGSYTDYADKPNALSDGVKFAATGNTFKSELDRPPGGTAILLNGVGTLDIGRDVALVMIYDAGVSGQSALFMINLVAGTSTIVSQSGTLFSNAFGTGGKINIDVNAGAVRIQNKEADTTLDAIVLKLHING